MLTLREKFELGTKGEWIAVVKAAIAQVASDVTHEKPEEIGFGATQEEALAAYPAVKVAEQIEAYQKRVTLARSVIASRDSLQSAAQRAAFLLASAMAEDVAKVNEAEGDAIAALMRDFLNDAAPVLGEQAQAKLDGAIMGTIRGGWSAMAGYNVHIEIPKAIGEASASA